MRVVIGGIPGVGKTTVLGYLIAQGLQVENFGDVMLREAVKRGYVNNRDQMRKMPLDKQLEIQRVAGEYFALKESVVIDTHLSVKTRSGYLPGLPFNILNIIKPGMIVYDVLNTEEEEVPETENVDLKCAYESCEEKSDEAVEYEYMRIISVVIRDALAEAGMKKNSCEG